MDYLNYTPKQFASLVNCAPRTVYKEIARGNLNAFHVGRSLRIPRSEYLRYVGANGGEAHGAA